MLKKPTRAKFHRIQRKLCSRFSLAVLRSSMYLFLCASIPLPIVALFEFLLSYVCKLARSLALLYLSSLPSVSCEPCGSGTQIMFTDLAQIKNIYILLLYGILFQTKFPSAWLKNFES